MNGRALLALRTWAILLVVGASIVALTHGSSKKVSTDGRAGASTTTAPGTTAGPAPAPGGSSSLGTAATGGASSGLPASTAATGEQPVVSASDGSPAPAARVQPTPGTYHVTTTGTASVNGQPQQVPPQGSFSIQQLNETDQRQTGEFELVIRWAPESASLVSMKIAAANKEFQPAQPVLYVPFPGDTGRNWEWTVTSTDGKTTMRQRSDITAQDTMNIDGQTVPVFVVETVATFSGDLTGTARLTSWVSPDYRLGLKQHSVIDVTFNLAVRVQSDTTSTLVRLTPD